MYATSLFLIGLCTLCSHHVVNQSFKISHCISGVLCGSFLLIQIAD